jgi:endogenous inhibitor of DNA gyrase (YacG/DUF329 family)
MGASDDMSAPCPKPYRPFCSRICSAAGLSVWVVTMSQPRLISVSVAASFGDRTRVDEDQLQCRIRVLPLRARMNEFTPSTTSGTL